MTRWRTPRPPVGPRASVRPHPTATLVAAGLLVGTLLLTWQSLAASPDPALLSRWWAATALATAVVLRAPRRWSRALVVVVGVGVAAGSLVAGRGVLASAGFALAAVVECALVVRWTTGFELERPLLRTWSDLRRWLVGIGLGCGAAGAVTAATLALDGAPVDAGAGELWRPLVWIALTHAESQAVALPLVLAAGGWFDRTRRTRRTEVVGHLAVLLLAALACATATGQDPVAFLLLPPLVWAAARFTPRWAATELLVVGVGLAAATALGHGPFARETAVRSLLDIAGSAQAFLLVSAVTTVSFAVATGHLRSSLRTIREHEARLGQLVDSAHGTAFVATDLTGTITWFSPGAELMLGYAASEVVGRTTPLAFHEVRELLARAQELGRTPDFGVVTAPVEAGADQDTRDWTWVRKDGSRLTVSVGVTRVRSDEGAPTGHLCVVRDVTDRRAAEQALVLALDRERETTQRVLDLDRATEDFVASVSHELRTPLTSIVGYTELLADEEVADNLTASQRRLVERIERNGERLLVLVEDLLTLARIEDGSLVVTRTPVDLAEAVAHVGAELAPTAHQHRVRLEVRVPEVPVCVDGDLAHLERLVGNLVANAVKFTPADGRVDVELTTDGVEALLVVRDTGTGIPAEDHERIFRRFFRSAAATEQAVQGTGLGLAIARAVAEAHGGVLAVDSAPGQGSTFSFRVPRSTPPVRRVEPPAVVPALEVLPPVVPGV